LRKKAPRAATALPCGGWFWNTALGTFQVLRAGLPGTTGNLKLSRYCPMPAWLSQASGAYLAVLTF